MLGTVVSGKWTAAVTKADSCSKLKAGPNQWRRLVYHDTPLWPGPVHSATFSEEERGMLQKWMLSLSQGFKETRKECSRWSK